MARNAGASPGVETRAWVFEAQDGRATDLVREVRPGIGPPHKGADLRQAGREESRRVGVTEITIGAKIDAEMVGPASRWAKSVGESANPF